LLLETSETLACSQPDLEMYQRIEKLITRLTYMEKFKSTKPALSQACDRLYSRVLELLNKDDDDFDPNLIISKGDDLSETSDLPPQNDDDYQQIPI
jgi:hypothetical protein